MFDQLKTYCRAIVPLTEEELDLIDTSFEIINLKKKEYLLQDGKICDFIGFVAEGTIRHFHIKDGLEKTCDISFENTWVTDFHSFKHNTPSIIHLQAMEDTVVFTITKQKLHDLYTKCSKYETFGRLMAEQVADRATEIAMSLSSDKPQERFQNLIQKQPALFQRVPQKYIANFLGINPESLSRIRRRILKNSKS